MPVDNRTSVAGNFSLTLDGTACGFVKSVEGGDISAPVVVGKTGPEGFAHKTIGPPVHEELKLEIGLGMTAAVYDWIAATWSQDFEAKNGSVVAADANLQAKSAREFTNALLTETTVPALDASSKTAAYLTVSIAPESTHSVKASGKLAAPKTTAKAFLPMNFRLDLDGVDTKKVTKIDAFTVRVRVGTAAKLGERRDIGRVPTATEFPNLFVTFAEAGSATWTSWFDDFVIKGNQKDRSGAIVLLSPDRKSELGKVTLHNVGICALRHPHQQAASDKVARLTAELFCDRMELRIGPAKKPG
jgi:tail tube protein gp19